MRFQPSAVAAGHVSVTGKNLIQASTYAWAKPLTAR